MGKIVFSDGGEYHRPGHPHVFPPGLRAAAHYLKAVEEVDSSVREQLREILRCHQLPRRLLSWDIVPLSEEELDSASTTEPTRAGRIRSFKFRWSFLEAFQDWLDQHHMWSRFVLDLLYRTLELWDRIDREIAKLQGSIREAKEYEKQRPLTAEDQQVVESDKARLEFLEGEREKGWGWWVDFLSSDITVPQLDAWLAGHGLCSPSTPGTLLPNMPSTPRKAAMWIFGRLKRAASKAQGVSTLSEGNRELLKRWDQLHIEIGWEPAPRAPLFQAELILGGWQPEVETWKAAKARFQESFDHVVEEYRRTCEERLKSGHLNSKPKDWYSQTSEKEKVVWGEPHHWEAVRTKSGDEHFRWLALRQIKGLRPSAIAKLPGSRRAVSTVNEAIDSTARLLQLELRPVRPGPPSVLGY